MDKAIVKELIYEVDEKRRMNFICSCNDSETLHLYAYNYNWCDGFNEPIAIIKNPACSMSTALTMFYLADGVEYLSDPEQEVDEYQADWLEFVMTLYHRIIAHDFIDASIKFEPPITNIELYNMKKDLSDEESIFYTPIEGIDCDVYV